ncbi:helix-turn-helix transcriptional regulator [Paraburkholderia sp. 31.1]|uniref:helix-turn-helix domain-containing protein n=1 Tax=Paraburkholderia sp. 31.1 TaxID=2615205 RepID=UPI001654D522|nr:helix-turn-helix transcriptional regulator [Paraburkholderia sp. 31.1]MBC8725814.1 helix-turn-helix transcriptional regulator [Paraburkholderia sp. 31.1]
MQQPNPTPDPEAMMANLTDFGKEIRKIRIERGEKMLDMSEKVNKSPSFLSAVETGRKPVPMQLVDDIVKVYQLSSLTADRLRQFAENSISEFRITPQREADQTLVAAFARKFDSLDDNQRESILRILLKD